MAGLTEQIGHYVAGPPAELDAAVRRTVTTGFVDTVGVMLAGAAEPVTGAVRGFVQASRSALQVRAKASQGSTTRTGNAPSVAYAKSRATAMPNGAPRTAS